MEPVTADTITDEQIRELLATSSDVAVIANCKAALSPRRFRAGLQRSQAAADGVERAARQYCAAAYTARQASR